jgi:hypothetical protein
MTAAELMANWNALIATATLGTQRGAPVSSAKLWPTVDLGPPPGPAERVLLRTAAANHLWQLAGVRIAPTQRVSPDIAPVTDAPLVSESAVWRLARMLAGDHRDLVPEWLALAAEARAIVPPHWLPLVLSALDAAERAAAGAVLGPHAEWLARRNPEWAPGLAPAAAEAVELWNHGTLSQRCAAFGQMRAADPTGARLMLESTWPTEPPDARAALMGTLLEAPGLSEADESFLEAALSDKRKEVRAAALECLCRLPGCAHAQRNLERLRSLLVMTDAKPGLLGKLARRRLEIALPESLDKAAVRDGVSAKAPAQQKLGERAGWLMQMVAMARPNHWCERFGCDIQTFLDAALATDYAMDLLLALAHASIRQHDAVWIAALATRLLAFQAAPEQQAVIAQTIPMLVAAAPPTERDRLVRQLLAASKPADLNLLQSALAAADVAWSSETTHLAFQLLAERTRLATSEYSHPRNTLAHWGRYAEVSTASAALARILEQTAAPSPWRNALEALQEIITFRLAMRQELST